MIKDDWNPDEQYNISFFPLQNHLMIKKKITRMQILQLKKKKQKISLLHLFQEIRVFNKHYKQYERVMIHINFDLNFLSSCINLLTDMCTSDTEKTTKAS